MVVVVLLNIQFILEQSRRHSSMFQDQELIEMKMLKLIQNQLQIIPLLQELNQATRNDRQVC